MREETNENMSSRSVTEINLNKRRTQRSMRVETSHRFEPQPETHSTGKESDDDAEECLHGGGYGEWLNYTVDWGHIVGENRFGDIYRGRDVHNGTEVCVLAFKGSQQRREGLREEAERSVALLLERWPDTIEVLGTFDCTEKGLVTVFSIPQLGGVEDIKAFFAQEAENAEEERALAEWSTAQETRQQQSDEDNGGVRIGHSSEVHFRGDKRTILNFSPVPTSGNPLRLKGGKIDIGKYVVDLKDVLGRGKFGTVYRGWNQEKGYEVAVKILTGPKSKRKNMLIEPTELNSLQKLRHPNILRMFDTFEFVVEERSEVNLLMILEFCRGGDLKQFLAHHHPLTEQQAKHVMRQLVNFLCFLKENRMMHRDLKPANILLTSRNIDEAVVKVADWGMAKKKTNSSNGPFGTNTSALFESAVGTAAYMSPERLSQSLYDYQAEVWALGVIMYELLFAQHPYLHSASSVRTPEQLLNAITRAEELEMSSHILRSNAKPQNDDDPIHNVPSQMNPLSRECYDLLRNILKEDFNTRYTIEQVRAHPWISRPEGLLATEEVQAAVKSTVEPAAADAETVNRVNAPTTKEHHVVSAETAKITEKISTSEAVDTVSPAAAGKLPPQVPFTEDQTGAMEIQGFGSSWSASQRQQFIFQALRDYFHILQHDVLEAESDPGRGIVLLSYAWKLLSAAVTAALREEHPSTEKMPSSDTFNDMSAKVPVPIRLIIPDDIGLMENYIQETAQRLKRNLPSTSTQKKLGSAPMKISSASLQGLEFSAESAITPSPPTPSLTLHNSIYPTAHTLLFQRAVSLIRTAATEELMLGDTDEQDNFMEEGETRPEGVRVRQQHMYEQAMAILRLILQQVVVRCHSSFHGTCSTTAGIDTEESNAVRVFTVPFVPLTDEADQRTVQALLHTVEKHYRRLVNLK